ncbi:MAG TPA: carboxypeptidase-like regulatory domain-containing protein [Candidatus Dormibacteraeota bacterium]|nr:carboxypeptidase-like regulatory domain-containing protein [Candidatus Dormibacteraeota bacterium]
MNRLRRRLVTVAASCGAGLLAGGCGGGATASSASGGAYGFVTAGPTCPVERADHPCPPRPVSAQVNAEDGSGHTVATTRTDQAGHYSLSLSAGTYTLVAVTGSTFPRCPRTPVTVRPGAATRADIGCDTGIR